MRMIVKHQGLQFGLQFTVHRGSQEYTRRA
jgi:hypothetical protein